MSTTQRVIELLRRRVKTNCQWPPIRVLAKRNFDLEFEFEGWLIRRRFLGNREIKQLDARGS